MAARKNNLTRPYSYYLPNVEHSVFYLTKTFTALKIPRSFGPGDEADISLKWQEKVFGPQEMLTIFGGDNRKRPKASTTKSTARKGPLFRLEVSWEELRGTITIQGKPDQFRFRWLVSCCCGIVRGSTEPGYLLLSSLRLNSRRTSYTW